MTIATVEAATPALLPVTTAGQATIEATARALVDAHKIGTALCRTAFVPRHFQGKPDDAAAAILYGSTIEMDPVTALQNIYVIGGKPALYARTMVAIVLSKGHEIWTEEESDGAVTVAGRRKGSDAIERVTWTAEMAQRAGYTSNANYKTNQRAMLYARASGDVARRIAPDALLGMAHNVEELAVAEPWDGTTAAPRQAQATSGADRMAAVLSPSPAPDIAASVEAPAPPAVTVDEGDDRGPASAGEASVTKAQLQKIGAAMRELGITEREDALVYVRDVIDREVESRNDLTKREASLVIESLENDQQPVEDPS